MTGHLLIARIAWMRVYILSVDIMSHKSKLKNVDLGWNL